MSDNARMASDDLGDLEVVIDDDLLGPELRLNPHAYFHRLRALDPVHWNAKYKAWVLTRYEDVVTGFRDVRLSSERIDADGFPLLGRWMVFLNPPRHTRLRRLVGNAFSPRAIASFRPRIEGLVEQLLDDARGPGEFISVFASPLPAMVIAELMGVPPADRARFLDWSDKIAGVVFGALNRPDRRARAEAGLYDFDAYFRDLAESSDGTLVAALAAATEGDDRLTMDEIVATCTLLLFAGHSTTTNLLATGLLSLLECPNELKRLRSDPSLGASAVEELLRFEGPTGIMTRVVVEPVEIGGRRIGVGDRVFLGVAAANRDPARFPEPDRLDVGRHDAGQLGFGYGIHHCLGAAVARLETEIALGAILGRFPDLRLPDGAAEWSVGLLGRSLRRLQVDFG
jgi:cytochrome P450